MRDEIRQARQSEKAEKAAKIKELKLLNKKARIEIKSLEKAATMRTQMDSIELMITKTDLNVSQICIKLLCDRSNFDNWRAGNRPMPKAKKDLFLKLIK